MGPIGQEPTHFFIGLLTIWTFNNFDQSYKIFNGSKFLLYSDDFEGKHIIFILNICIGQLSSFLSPQIYMVYVK